MTSTLQVRIDNDLRVAADGVFADIGMDTNSAIRLFLRQTVIRKTFPFEVISSDPFHHPANQAFLARAAKDYESGAKHYHAHDLVESTSERDRPSKESSRRRSRGKTLV